MDYEEAKEWLQGNRSVNYIPQDPFETWHVRLAQADAAMMQQAYYIVMYHERKGGDVNHDQVYCDRGYTRM